MAATGTEVPTYEQLKKLVDSKAGGGASLELLWEGVATIEQGEYADLNVDLGSHDLILVVGDHGDDSICFATIVRPIGEQCHHFTGYQSDAHISADATYIFGPVFYTTHIYKVYAIPTSGGGVAPEPEPEPTGTVLFETYGEQTGESGPLDLDGYSYIEIACHSSTTTGMVETIYAPFHEAKASKPYGAFHLTQYSETTFSVDAVLPAYIDKITAYK